jgi:biopolymer transport protein ExbD
MTTEALCPPKPKLLLIAHTLREKVGADSTHQVLIAADKRLLYEDVVRLLDWVRGSGVRKYALKVVENG